MNDLITVLRDEFHQGDEVSFAVLCDVCEEHNIPLPVVGSCVWCHKCSHDREEYWANAEWEPRIYYSQWRNWEAIDTEDRWFHVWHLRLIRRRDGEGWPIGDLRSPEELCQTLRESVEDLLQRSGFYDEEHVSPVTRRLINDNDADIPF